MQPDHVVEVDEEKPDMGVLDDVAEAPHDTVAPILRPADVLLVEHPHETGGPGPECAVAVADRAGGGEEHHLLPGDEVPHRVVEMRQCLPRVEGVGAFPGAKSVLQVPLAMVHGDPPVARTSSPWATVSPSNRSNS